MIRSKPKSRRINWNSIQYPGVTYWASFLEGGGSSVLTRVPDLNGGYQVGTTSAMESSDWGEDEFGTYLEFDGVDEHVLVGSAASSFIGLPTAPFTVLVWARADGYPTTRDSIISTDNGSGSQGFSLRLENGGAPANGAVFSVGAFNATAASFAAADFTVTDLNHYAGRFDGTNIDIFVNGLKGTSSTGAGAGIYSYPLYLGVGFNDFPDRNFNGKIYDARIIPRALTDAEIRQHYHPDTRFDLYDKTEIVPFVPIAPPVAGDSPWLHYRQMMR